MHKDLQQQLLAVKKENKDIQEQYDAYREEMNDAQETIELSTLDKEMAEEKVSVCVRPEIGYLHLILDHSGVCLRADARVAKNQV